METGPPAQSKTKLELPFIEKPLFRKRKLKSVLFIEGTQESDLYLLHNDENPRIDIRRIPASRLRKMDMNVLQFAYIPLAERTPLHSNGIAFSDEWIPDKWDEGDVGALWPLFLKRKKLLKKSVFLTCMGGPSRGERKRGVGPMSNLKAEGIL